MSGKLISLELYNITRTHGINRTSFKVSKLRSNGDATITKGSKIERKIYSKFLVVKLRDSVEIPIGYFDQES